MWEVFGLVAFGFVCGFVIARTVFEGRPQTVKWENLPEGQYFVFWIDSVAMISGAYRFISFRMREADNHKIEFLEVSGCPSSMSDIKGGDTFCVTRIQKQKIPAHKELTIYHAKSHSGHES